MKLLYICIGCLALAVGTIGIILPILPTTPFFLLAAICFAKGSTRIHAKFVASKLYQNHLESFVKERAMTLRTKVMIYPLLVRCYSLPCILWKRGIYDCFC